MKSTIRPDYGVDAPHVLRNFFIIGLVCVVAGMLSPLEIHLGRSVSVYAKPLFFWPAGILLAEALLFLLYVRVGKFRHRDLMLSLHAWQGDEQVLDVGCGRGLLLAGAAHRLRSGHATGIDVWSNEDMGGNSPEATQQNLLLESVDGLCTLKSEGAQAMSFADGSFDVALSNLCLHNIYDRAARQTAVAEIARVLKPGGLALLSDYKLTAQYAQQLQEAGFLVERKRGSLLTTFPPLTIVIARKPMA